MIKKLVVALACLGFAANAGAEVNFDMGLDVKSMVTDIKAEASKDLYTYPIGTHFSHYSRDCRSFSFGPSAGPVSSPRAYLSSTEYVEVCRMVPVQHCHTEYTQHCRTVMVPGPNGTQVPRQECTQVPHQVCRTVYEQRCYTQAGCSEKGPSSHIVWHPESPCIAVMLFLALIKIQPALRRGKFAASPHL